MNKDEAITRALKAAIAYSSEPMVLSDPRLPDNPLVAVNGAFLDMTGYAHDEVIGRNCRFLQGTNTDPDTRARIRACIAAGQGCIEWIANRRRDGRAFWTLLFLSPIRGADGSVIHYFGNQQDMANGLPAGLLEFSLGAARMPAELEQRFRGLLDGILDEIDAASWEAGAPGHAVALERVIAAAREIAMITVRLSREGNAPG